MKLVFARSLEPFVGTIYYALQAVFAADVLFTIRRLIRFDEAMERLKMFSDQIKERYEGEAWFNAGDLHATLAELKVRIDEGKVQASERMKERVAHFVGSTQGTQALIKKFPTMTSRHYKAELDHARKALKESLEARLEQKRQEREARRAQRRSKQ